MHRNRLDEFTVKIGREGLTGFLIAPGPNLRYLTSLNLKAFERLAILARNSEGRLGIVAPKLDEGKIRALPEPPEPYLYTDTDGPNAAVRSCLESLGLRNCMVGVESGLPWSTVELLRDQAGLGFADITGILAGLRCIKDPGEIDSLRKASTVLQDALRAVIYDIEPGMSESEVAARIEYEARKLGAEGVPFGAVQSGMNSAIPHFEYSGKKIEDGDIVVVDVGCVVEGYHADITRTIIVGKPSEKQRRIYEIVKEAQTAAINKCAPGIVVEDVDRAARSIIAREGFGEFFVHRTGHGLGLEVHEEPYIKEGNKEKLLPGMALTVEPGIYLPGEFGVRIEDNIIVTQDGIENLTTLSKELTVT